MHSALSAIADRYVLSSLRHIQLHVVRALRRFVAFVMFNPASRGHLALNIYSLPEQLRHITISGGVDYDIYPLALRLEVKF